jgi:hypothetical protein
MLAKEWRQISRVEKSQYMDKYRQSVAQFRKKAKGAGGNGQRQKQIVLQIPSQGGVCVFIPAFIEE